MPTVRDYDYYNGVLSIYVQTNRLEDAVPGVLVSAPIHEEYAARVRCALRQYKNAFQPYLPAFGLGNLPVYAIRAIRPRGSNRGVDDRFNQDVLSLQWQIEFGIQPSAFLELDEEVVMAFERNMEKAVFDLFASLNIPNATISSSDTGLGDSWIDIRFELGSEQNLGLVEVP